jgi:uncharacterized membrane protein YeaQ/YmgE (transglycosylase-associated protein family)
LRAGNAPRGPIRNLIVGLIGSLLGGFLFGKLGLQVVPDFWGELITAPDRRGVLGPVAGGPTGLAQRPAARP